MWKLNGSFTLFGYKVVTKGSVVSVKVTSRKRTALAETRNAESRIIMDHEFSQVFHTELIEGRMRRVTLVNVEV
jgi:hypothetical protein